jgi:hypothetical protein
MNSRTIVQHRRECIRKRRAEAAATRDGASHRDVGDGLRGVAPTSDRAGIVAGELPAVPSQAAEIPLCTRERTDWRFGGGDPTKMRAKAALVTVAGYLASSQLTRSLSEKALPIGHPPRMHYLPGGTD